MRGLMSLAAAGLLFFIVPVFGGVLFDTLPNSLIVTTSAKQGQVLVAGVDKITLTWKLNQSLPAGSDSAYKEVKLRLCYAPVSQKGRQWRKTTNDLKKDKTCQFGITKTSYTDRRTTATFDYTVERDVPTATYFVRAYVLNSAGDEVAYGQTNKATNLFDITGISGRSVALDVAAGCFSAFSVLSLAVFFVIEKRKKNK